MPTYRSTFLDRHADGAYVIQAAGWGVLVAVASAWIAGLSRQLDAPGAHGWLWCLGIGATAGAITAVVVYHAFRGAGAAFLSFLQPSGSSCPAPAQYSKLDALAAGGNVAEALVGFARIARAEPANVAVRLQAADLHWRTGTDLRRAETLLREVQACESRTADDDLRASQRLVDLYLGALDDRGRALRELRRIADRHPGSEAGVRAGEAIARLKSAPAA